MNIDKKMRSNTTQWFASLAKKFLGKGGAGGKKPVLKGVFPPAIFICFFLISILAAAQEAPRQSATWQAGGEMAAPKSQALPPPEQGEREDKYLDRVRKSIEEELSTNDEAWREGDYLPPKFLLPALKNPNRTNVRIYYEYIKAKSTRIDMANQLLMDLYKQMDPVGYEEAHINSTKSMQQVIKDSVPATVQVPDQLIAKSGPKDSGKVQVPLWSTVYIFEPSCQSESCKKLLDIAQKYQIQKSKEAVFNVLSTTDKFPKISGLPIDYNAEQLQSLRDILGENISNGFVLFNPSLKLPDGKKPIKPYKPDTISDLMNAVQSQSP